jgi:AcrR family transcriptional regulator
LATQDKTDLRKRILDTAAELFYRDGVRSVGVDRIAAEAGVAKMTLYYHFRSKDELVAAWLRRRDEEWMSWLADAVERRDGSPLLAVFEALREWFETPDFRGCAFINAHAELGWSCPAAMEIVAAHKRSLGAYLARLAEAEGAVEPEALARELLLLVDGAIVTASIQGNAGVADDAREAAARVMAGFGLASRTRRSRRSAVTSN